MKKETRLLLEKIRSKVASGEPIHPQTIRIARSQASLRGVTPQYMILSSDRMFHVLPAGVLDVGQLPRRTEIHDMWRPSKPFESSWRIGADGAPVDCDELGRGGGANALTPRQFHDAVRAAHIEDVSAEIARLTSALDFAVRVRQGYL